MQQDNKLQAPKMYNDAKPQSPSSTSTNSFSGISPSISSKTHEVSAMSTTSSGHDPIHEQTSQPQQRKIGRWYIGETLGKGGYSWYVIFYYYYYILKASKKINNKQQIANKTTTITTVTTQPGNNNNTKDNSYTASFIVVFVYYFPNLFWLCFCWMVLLDGFFFYCTFFVLCWQLQNISHRVKKGRDEKNGKFVALKFVDRKKSNGKFSNKVSDLHIVFPCFMTCVPIWSIVIYCGRMKTVCI